ncbi:MAG: deoxyguanosinetriphosphate triphosphohydrolase [Candidatus Omnitrophota bacterium]
MKSKQYYEYEKHFLMPYATKSASSKGRVHKEAEHLYRPIYQRDRERIIHSTAFRRLEYKTQVFVNHEGDYYRTRLTHTLEVAQIARSIARALGVNEDLSEAIALAHDLGHTPFGHSGEDALAQIMKEHGGFNHNVHALRVVDHLETRYPNFRGLNLTAEVREGIIKHTTSYDVPEIAAEFEPELSASLETQIVNAADEIAYDSHDLDDGLASNILSEGELRKVLLWKETAAKIKKSHSNLKEQVRQFQVIKEIINSQVTDLINTTEARIKKNKIRSYEDVRRFSQKLVTFSTSMHEKRERLRIYLYDNLYRHFRVLRMANKARRFITELFEVYISQPEQLPLSYRARVKVEGGYRVVCDYIAGMTDRYALNEYKKLFEPYEKV